MKKVIKSFKDQLKEYQGLVADFEAKGIENLDYTDTEEYGVYKGKAEILEDLIPKLEAMDFDTTELWETDLSTSHDCIKVDDIIKIFTGKKK